VDVFTTLFGMLQTALDTYIHEAVSNAVNYVDGPIAAMATAVIIGLGIMFMMGMSAWPFKELLKTFATIALVFGLAGSVGHYNEYLGNFIHGLPGDLMGVFAVGDAPADEQGFGETMDAFGATAMDGINTIWSAGGGVFSGLGYKLLAIVLFGIFLVFAIAACVAMGIAMLGSSLVVGIGPIMILGLFHKSTHEYFTRWISYGIQFAFLAAFVGGVLGVMNEVLNEYLRLLTQQTAEIDITQLAGPGIIMGICAYIFGQLPSMASSVSGGIGLSVGNTAWRGLSKATQGTIWHSGGKQVDAYFQAGHRRRIEKSVQGREQRGEWWRDKWEGAVNPNKVDGE
jgi:type IV secretion system protein VirB6